jgi:hypothetical protein
MTAPFPRWILATIVPAAVAALAACGESATSFDPVGLSQSTDAVINAMEGSPAFQSITVLGDKMTLGAPSLTATRSGHPDAAAAPENVFPPGIPLGTTFVYDPAQQKYVASVQTGAPSNGVRFILYAVPVSTPPSAIGHVDLLDQTTALQVQAFLTGNTNPVLDYTASASVQGSGDAVTAATLSGKGSVSGATLTVTLDTLTQTFSTSTGIGMHHKVSVAEEGLSFDFQAGITLLQTLQGTLTVRHGENTTVVAGSGNLTSFSGTIKQNGKEVITFSGPSADPVFLLSSGGQPTAEQLTALRKLSDFTTQLPCAIATMLKPAAKLFTPTVPSLPCS